MQLNKFEIIGDLEGQVTWFPWVGTRTINAASLLIEIASGEHPQRTELTIKSNYSSLLQTAEFANKLGMESCFDQIFNLIVSNESKFNFPKGKWSWLLPEDLILRDAMKRELNIEEAINLFKSFKEIKVQSDIEL